MTRKDQDAMADALRKEWRYNGNIADEEAAGSAQRAVSRLAQVLADTFTYSVPGRFDRARFVGRCAFGFDF